VEKLQIYCRAGLGWCMPGMPEGNGRQRVRVWALRGPHRCPGNQMTRLPPDLALILPSQSRMILLTFGPEFEYVRIKNERIVLI
jgi:hypothetical protein